ncbi:putative serine-threonine/tyrosine-protein kinase catalytic domain-containing protein, partial [Tanacetum coccineum]
MECLTIRHKAMVGKPLVIINSEENMLIFNLEGDFNKVMFFQAGDLERLRVPLEDIILATDNFTKRYLGSGGYGRVYRAQLDLLMEEKKGEYIKKQTTVAIKCIRKDKYGEEGFVAEIELLTRCKHENIVSLLGFCDEGEELILVYEHASNRSLDDYLVIDNLTNLAWAQRLKTCIDIARGLNYLHTEVEDKPSIIH